ncbi:hypothetical protein ACS126_03635 [Sphingobacterium lactis]|uniref:hypothetical protein n=1 Tax=Sphingobacterium TaxID=28453 RepID=UPI0021A52980|nr:hypothetical protein [Sphingobacterium hotanense]MCT1526061.1 hypothetical protein [Sphingobacterium hotanense]
MKIGSIALVVLCKCALWVNAQETKFTNVTVSLDGGRIGIVEGDFMGRPNDELYNKILDSTATVLKQDSLNTGALFLTALLKSQYYLMRPSTDEQLVALEESSVAIDSAFAKGIDDLTSKVLRARIYYQLMSCFIADEGWRYERPAVRRERKTRFERYQALSNKYHGELETLDPANAHDYRKRISNASYPLKVVDETL